MAAVVEPANLPTFHCPKRPEEGTEGRIIRLKANHFPITIKAANLFHYEVTIVPEKCPRKVNR